MRFSQFKFNGSSLLIGVSGVAAAAFLAVAVHGLWGYFRLEEKLPASVYHWKVIEKSSSQFAIRASYTFEREGKTYRGKTIFSKPYHLNRISAEKQIKNFIPHPWQAWHQPGRPAISSLEKVFPVKKCLYALMALGVSLYFLYVRKKYAAFYDLRDSGYL
jgi:hypothetical protein